MILISTAWCAIPSTVHSYHTDVVLLVVVQKDFNGCVGGDKSEFLFIWLGNQYESYDVDVNHDDITCSPSQY